MTGNGKPERRGGRKKSKRGLYKFDAETAETIVSYIQAGAFIETAASAAGISKQTLYAWLRQGKREGSGPVWEWSREARKALALSEVAMIGSISAAAQGGQWQAAAWHLERKFPERWRKKESVEHTGPGGGPLQTVTAPVLSTGEKRARLAELLKKFAEEEKKTAEREAAAEQAAINADLKDDGSGKK